MEELVEEAGVVFLLVLSVLVLLLARRTYIDRGGAVDMAVRLSARVPGRGWALGMGRFVGEQLRWYRTFSFSPRPRRVMRRTDLSVQGRRSPEGPEAHALPRGSVILTCVTDRRTVEIAMAETALTGFLSWLEAAPPGAASRRLRIR